MTAIRGMVVIRIAEMAARIAMTTTMNITAMKTAAIKKIIMIRNNDTAPERRLSFVIKA